MSVYLFRLLHAAAIDGDTIRVELDLGMRIRWQGDLRLSGINAPEVHSRRALEKQAGLLVRTAAQVWIDTGSRTIDGCLWVRSDERPEKFGRLLGDVIEGRAEEVYMDTCDTLSYALLKLGCVKEYHGERKAAWTDAELQRIVDELGGKEP